VGLNLLLLAMGLSDKTGCFSAKSLGPHKITLLVGGWDFLLMVQTISAKQQRMNRAFSRIQVEFIYFI